MNIFLSLIALFIAGLIAFFFNRKKGFGYVLMLFPLLFLYFLIPYHNKILNGEYLNISVEWLSILGVHADIFLDSLGYLFAITVSFIGLLVLLYAEYYMRPYKDKGRFYGILMIFMASMLGLVSSSNLLMVFVYWELTSFTSYLLVSYDHEKEIARVSAFQALLVTFAGGLALLIAVIFLGNIAGSYNLHEIYAHKSQIINSHYFVAIQILIFIAAFTKSAQFPFHFWLPGAMNAPTPVSAFLHSATMVKAGIFLLLRMNPLLGDNGLWVNILTLFGGLTMLIGAFYALAQSDLKRVLAFTTISALGLMVLLIGIDTDLSIKAALVFFIVHALYKAALFMITGIIDKKEGTRDMLKLENIFFKAPLLFSILFLSLLSMAGLPPLLGFIGKELIYEAKIQTHALNPVLIFLGVGSNILLVAISLIVLQKLAFKGKASIELFRINKIHITPGFMLPPLVLSTLSLMFGLAPALLNGVIEESVFNVRAKDIYVNFKLWHGVNPVLLMSIFTVLSGFIVFLYRKKAIAFAVKITGFFNKLYLPDIFNKLIDKSILFSSRYSTMIQHGYHRYYLMTFFVFTLLVLGWQIFIAPGWMSEFNPGSIVFFPFMAAVIIILAAIFAIFTNSRLVAILALGIVGYGTGLLYMYYGAIDLSITQFLAETLIMMLFVMVVYKLPAFVTMSSRRSRSRDAFIGVASGILLTVMVIQSGFIQIDQPVSDYFLREAFPAALGKNVVNVILVDFRALDTLGEIIVLTLAAVGIYAMLKFKSSENEFRSF